MLRYEIYCVNYAPFRSYASTVRYGAKDLHRVL